MGDNQFGQNYKYFKFIKTPDQLGLSPNGSLSSIGTNVNGLISYVRLLVEGTGDANNSRPVLNNSGNPELLPLGDRYFINTKAKCTDLKTKKQVTRSIYIDNVPDGSIPFITQGLGDAKFSSIRGLIPGMLSNISHISPSKIFTSLMNGQYPYCLEVNRTTINENGEHGNETRYLIRDDIETLNNNNIDKKSKEEYLKEFDRLRSGIKEGFSSSSKTDSNFRYKDMGVQKNPHLYMEYSKDRPYYSSYQKSYISPYKKEKKYESKNNDNDNDNIPEYTMKFDEIDDKTLLYHTQNKSENDSNSDSDSDSETEIRKIKKNKKMKKSKRNKKNRKCYQEIVKDVNLSEVPQIREINLTETKLDITNKDKDKNTNLSIIPDDLLIKLYYGSLSIIGLYVFLRLLEKQKQK